MVFYKIGAGKENLKGYERHLLHLASRAVHMSVPVTEIIKKQYKGMFAFLLTNLLNNIESSYGIAPEISSLTENRFCLKEFRRSNYDSTKIETESSFQGRRHIFQANVFS